MVCEFRVVVDGQRGLWLPVVCWGPLAGSCYRRLRAGHRVAFSGPLQVDEYVSRAGDRQRRWYLKAEHATFLDDKPATDTSAAASAARGVPVMRAQRLLHAAQALLPISPGRAVTFAVISAGHRARGRRRAAHQTAGLVDARRG